ncbi:hypothetical protein RSOLAG22IIIB_11994 [Rhizoctonia solani]|uniref:Uncharacterized protein n=1 Tax=Rhizoctonia solani TaxID=456999 RepID=A0A0K6GBC8_9AGAM|nr:hypothetical protein RSOLAG22IIIB_11994 [Rhizoctonia solani]
MDGAGVGLADVESVILYDEHPRSVCSNLREEFDWIRQTRHQLRRRQSVRTCHRVLRCFDSSVRDLARQGPGCGRSRSLAL